MYHHHSIRQFHQEIESGQLTCTQVVQSYLSRIRELSRLNAFVDVYASEALKKAEALDERHRNGQPKGRLFGVVIGIKDVICYAGHKLTAASGILDGFESLFSATAVERLLEEDAIIIGSLNCDEFAMGSSNEHSVYGKVRNALDEERVPGGSSGGSAVAVQANLCMVSLGSDTGGSVRQPADFCGIIGLKPTYGRISRHGLIAYASSFDQIGIFSVHTEDAALLLEIMAGDDAYDSTASSEPVPAYSQMLQAERPLRFTYFPESFDHPSLDPEIRAAGLALIEKLKADGHSVEPSGFDYLDYIVPAYYVLTTAEASSNLSRYDGVKFGARKAASSDDLTAFYEENRSKGFGKEVKRRIMLGNFVLSSGYYDAYFTQAQKVRQGIISHTEKIFREADVLLMPTVPAPAFRFGEKSDDPIAMFLGDLYTVYANLAGIPAISVPMGRHHSGMPFGIQLMTNRFKEDLLLQAASLLTVKTPTEYA